MNHYIFLLCIGGYAMKSRKMKILLLSACAVVLVAWVIFLVFILGDKKEKKKLSDGKVRIWCLTEGYEVDENGEEKLLFKGQYDDKGRCVRAEYSLFYGDSGKLRYDYDPETHCTIETTETETYKEVMIVGPDGNNKTRESRTINKDGTLGDGDGYIFDKAGNVVQRISYDTKGREAEKILSEYDSCGHLISYAEYDLIKGKTEVFRQAEYDDQGRLLASYKSDRNLPVLSVTYAEDGSREEQEWEDDVYRIYTYDPSGKLVKKVTEADYGESIRKTVTIYSGEYDKVTTAYIDDEPTEEETTSCRQEDGCFIKQLVSKSFRNDTETVIMIQTVTYRLHGDSKYEDERYDSVEYERDYMNNNRASVRYEYTYDENDNLIACKKTQTQKGETKYLVGRIYVYEEKVISEEQKKENDGFFDSFYDCGMFTWSWLQDSMFYSLRPNQ